MEGGEGTEGEVKGFAGPLSNCCLRGWFLRLLQIKENNFISVRGAQDRIIQGLP